MNLWMKPKQIHSYTENRLMVAKGRMGAGLGLAYANIIRMKKQQGPTV